MKVLEPVAEGEREVEFGPAERVTVTIGHAPLPVVGWASDADAHSLTFEDAGGRTVHVDLATGVDLRVLSARLLAAADARDAAIDALLERFRDSGIPDGFEAFATA